MGKNMAIQNQRVKYADSIVSGEEFITGSTIKELIDKKDYFYVELTNEEYAQLQDGGVNLNDRFSTELLTKNLIIVHNNDTENDFANTIYLIRTTYSIDSGEHMIEYKSCPTFGKAFIGGFYSAYIDYTPGEGDEEPDFSFGISYLNEYKPTRYDPCLYEHQVTIKHTYTNVKNFIIKFLSSYPLNPNTFEKLTMAVHDNLCIITGITFETSPSTYTTVTIANGFNIAGDFIYMSYLDPDVTAGVVNRQISKNSITSITAINPVRRPIATYKPS